MSEKQRAWPGECPHGKSLSAPAPCPVCETEKLAEPCCAEGDGFGRAKCLRCGMAWGLGDPIPDCKPEPVAGWEPPGAPIPLTAEALSSATAKGEEFIRDDHGPAAPIPEAAVATARDAGLLPDPAKEGHTLLTDELVRAADTLPRVQLTTDAKERKATPMARGLLDYFPNALADVANLSRIGNEQHNPGQPMHWAKEKSVDHADCIMRHLVDRGTFDKDGVRHSTKVLWRAAAQLEIEILAERGDPEAIRQIIAYGTAAQVARLKELGLAPTEKAS